MSKRRQFFYRDYVMNKWWISLALGFFTSQLMAFPCYVTMIKQNCWKDYDVTVEITDAVLKKQLASAEVPSDELWTRVKFECKPEQSLSFVAQFSPAIWGGEEEKVYPAKRNWFLPSEITPGMLAWNIDICFPRDFSSVPAPVRGSSNCICDSSNIPKVTIE